MRSARFQMLSMLFTTACFSSVLSPVFAADAQPSPSSLVLREASTVSLHLTQTITSKSATVGQLVPAVVATSVMIGQSIVIPAGADAMVQVSTLAKASSHGHRGSITLMPQWVKDINGNRVPLAPAGDTFEGKGTGGAAGAATVAATTMFIVPGLFVHNFFKGGEVTITPETVFAAQTAADDIVAAH